MQMTGTQVLVNALIEQGCDTVFGYPGGAVINIYDELYRHTDKIKHIITAHEQGAAHAADAYARVSGKVGVVIATSGPGATNLVTGLANAYLDSSPMVAITGNVATSLLGKDSFQEVDITGITMPITKHNYIVKDTSELAAVVREAFHIARSGRPGPVLIDIPKDIQTSVGGYDKGKPEKAQKRYDVTNEQLECAAKLIAESSSPYIYCGGGIVRSDAGGLVEELSCKINAPIGFSMMGLSAVSADHPNWMGLTGMHGRYASIVANAECDLIIACGVRFSDRATGNKDKYIEKAKIIHIDIDPAEIDKNIPVYCGLIGDAKKVLRKLIDTVVEKKNDAWMQRMNELKAEEAMFNDTFSSMHPKTVLDVLMQYTNEDTVIATDVGQHQMWTAQYYGFKKPRTFVTSGGLGTMGFGMGAAIGACFANDKKRTVLITGDGSFGMNLNETATAVSNNLPLVVLIFNNGVLGMVRQWQDAFFENRYSETTLDRKTDFAALANAFGATGLRAVDSASLKEALDTAFATDGPVIIDCIIDKDDKVLPMIPPGGSVDSMIK